MSARIERTVPTKAVNIEPVIVDFDVERLKAPFLLRCGAVLIDYILLISVLVISLLLGRFYGLDGIKLLNGEFSSIGWLVAALLILTNFIIFPLFTSQTIGKLLTGIKIVRTDGSAPSIWRLLVRHLVGYPLTVLSGGIGLLLAVVIPSGRALHDFLAGTVVVYGRRRTERKELR